jgi:hypothetical protein
LQRLSCLPSQGCCVCGHWLANGRPQHAPASGCRQDLLSQHSLQVPCAHQDGPCCDCLGYCCLPWLAISQVWLLFGWSVCFGASGCCVQDSILVYSMAGCPYVGVEPTLRMQLPHAASSPPALAAACHTLSRGVSLSMVSPAVCPPIAACWPPQQQVCGQPACQLQLGVLLVVWSLWGGPARPLGCCRQPSCCIRAIQGQQQQQGGSMGGGGDSSAGHWHKLFTLHWSAHPAGAVDLGGLAFGDNASSQAASA